MSVTLTSQDLSDLRLIPTLYAKISAFYAKVPAVYAELPDFYAYLSIFGFHCAVMDVGEYP